MDTLASVGQNEVLRTNAQRQVDAKLLQLQMQRSSNMQAPNNMLQTIDGHMIQVRADRHFEFPKCSPPPPTPSKVFCVVLATGKLSH